MSYRMDIQTLTFLAEPEGKKLIQEIKDSGLTEKNLLTVVTKLRKRYPSKIVSAAADVILLREKAAAKFSRFNEMFFTKESLEQSSGEIVSSHRAERFRKFKKVCDLGCGIGADTVNLAKNSKVIAIDRDELRLEMAALNAKTYRVDNKITFLKADYTKEPIPDCDAIFIDPSRRKNYKRARSIFEYDPPLSFLKELLNKTSNIGVKISPAVDYDELESLGLNFELEIISKDGECKEAVLWLGELRSKAVRRATILPQNENLTAQDKKLSIDVTDPQSYLYEPDGSVIRAHLVEELAHKYGLTKIDSMIAYLTSQKPIDTPYAKRYEIEEAQEFNLKKLNKRLQQLNVGEVVIKKRGSPIDPDTFTKRLKLKGENKKIIFFTHVKNRPFMIICRYGKSC